MDPSARGKRDQVARDKIKAMGDILVDELGLPLYAISGFKKRYKRDPLIDAMFQREATALLLETVVQYLRIEKDAIRKQVEYETRQKIKAEQYAATMPVESEPESEPEPEVEPEPPKRRRGGPRKSPE